MTTCPECARLQAHVAELRALVDKQSGLLEEAQVILLESNTRANQLLARLMALAPGGPEKPGGSTPPPSPSSPPPVRGN